MRKYLRRRMDAYDAFLRCQVHMINLAEAYIERVVLEQFLLAVKAVGSDLLPVMQKLCSLYALHTIESHKGWYLEQDYIQGPKSKAIRRMVDKLCFELRKDAGALVDAFGIPEQSIAAPIVG